MRLADTLFHETTTTTGGGDGDGSAAESQIFEDDVAEQLAGLNLHLDCPSVPQHLPATASAAGQSEADAAVDRTETTKEQGPCKRAAKRETQPRTVPRAPRTTAQDPSLLPAPSPARAILQPTRRVLQVSAIPHDVPGSGPGKENIPPRRSEDDHDPALKLHRPKSGQHDYQRRLAKCKRLPLAEAAVNFSPVLSRVWVVRRRTACAAVRG
ncbi:MAG: hypothetical protein M1826_000623 [Phylliscum demangeonii]|nr:MAG: hypothetical protein M1826_000623 [Phylliscum demangeonii]